MGGRRRQARRAAGLGAVASVLAVAGFAGPVAGASAAAGATGPGVTARVATYNIHAGSGSDGVFDLDRTAAAIAALDADVVGLQEADVHWGARSSWQDTVTELGRRLGMRTAFGPIYSLDPPSAGDPRREYGVALLTRHPVVAVENHELTRQSTIFPGTPPGPMPGFLEAVVQIRGARTHVYVTHLDYRGDPTLRSVEVGETLDILAEDPPGARQVLVGDLNAEPGDPELDPLWTRLGDAWAMAPDRVGGPGLTFPALDPVKRIDVVAVSDGIEVLDAATQSDPTLVAASDHRAVVATLRLPHPHGSENTP